VRHKSAWFLLVLAGVLHLLASQMTHSEEVMISQGEGAVYVIPVKGVIDLGLAGFIQRIAEDAKAAKARAVIFEIDTFGGRVDAAIQISKSIGELSPIPVVAYVTDRAWSAGALIALACQNIIMAPGSSIGSAEPRVGGMRQEPTDEKTVSALRAEFKALAEKNNHPQNLAQAMVDKDIELKKVRIRDKTYILTTDEIEEKKAQFRAHEIKIVGTVIKKDKLLNLTAGEAEELKLVSAVLPDRTTLLDYFELSDYKIVESSPNWSEVLVRFLTHPVISSILLTLGFLGMIFELRMPGFGVSGVIGLICLVLFFWGHYLVGLANWVEIALFCLGVVLLLLEILVIPGFGLAGISGIILIVASIFLGLIKHPFQIPKNELIGAFNVTAYAIIATFLVILLSFKFIPQTAIWKRFVLTGSEMKEQGFRVSALEGYLGKEGKALTILRPAGRALFGEEILDVVTEGDFIEKDRAIKVIKVEGNRIVVAEV